MATCLSTISGGGAIPTFISGVPQSVNFNAVSNSLLQMALLGPQTVYLSTNITTSATSYNFTVSFISATTLVNVGSVVITNQISNLSINLLADTYYVCFRSLGPTYTGSVTATFIRFPTRAAFVMNAAFGDSCNLTGLKITQPHLVCNQPMIWELVDGELPKGITLLRNGMLTGTLPYLDCDIAGNNAPPSNNNFYVDQINGITYAIPRSYNFTAKLTLESDHNKFDIQKFSITIVPNWDKMIRGFKNYKQESKMVVTRVPKTLPTSLCNFKDVDGSVSNLNTNSTMSPVGIYKIDIKFNKDRIDVSDDNVIVTVHITDSNSSDVVNQKITLSMPSLLTFNGVSINAIVGSIDTSLKSLPKIVTTLPTDMNSVGLSSVDNKTDSTGVARFTISTKSVTDKIGLIKTGITLTSHFTDSTSNIIANASTLNVGNVESGYTFDSINLSNKNSAHSIVSQNNANAILNLTSQSTSNDSINYIASDSNITGQYELVVIPINLGGQTPTSEQLIELASSTLKPVISSNINIVNNSNTSLTVSNNSVSSNRDLGDIVNSSLLGASQIVNINNTLLQSVNDILLRELQILAYGEYYMIQGGCPPFLGGFSSISTVIKKSNLSAALIQLALICTEDMALSLTRLAIAIAAKDVPRIALFSAAISRFNSVRSMIGSDMSVLNKLINFNFKTVIQIASSADILTTEMSNNIDNLKNVIANNESQTVDADVNNTGVPDAYNMLSSLNDGIINSIETNMIPKIVAWYVINKDSTDEKVKKNITIMKNSNMFNVMLYNSGYSHYTSNTTKMNIKTSVQPIGTKNYITIQEIKDLSPSILDQYNTQHSSQVQLLPLFFYGKFGQDCSMELTTENN